MRSAWLWRRDGLSGALRLIAPRHVEKPILTVKAVTEADGVSDYVLWFGHIDVVLIPDALYPPPPAPEYQLHPAQKPTPATPARAVGSSGQSHSPIASPSGVDAAGACMALGLDPRVRW
jgi:hypothetical protein